MLRPLEREREVLAPTLPGHHGGPSITGEVTDDLLPAAVERAMDEAGFETADIAGNSLGAWVALQLAARGRARSVVAFAPAGGWAAGDRSVEQLLAYQLQMKELLQDANVLSIVATVPGRRRATEMVATNFEHIPPDLLAHQLNAAMRCDGATALVEHARVAGWHLDAERITCPVRIAWGREDKLLPWPLAASRFADEWLPHADWVELEGVGHCPQLDVPLETAQLILGFTAR